MPNHRQLAALVALTALVLVLAGCPAKSFVLTQKQICATVDSAGKPGPPKATFTVADPQVVFWFSYQNAPTGMPVKAQFTHASKGGGQTAATQSATLHPGNGTAYLIMKPLPGKGLEPGNYQVDLQNADGASMISGTKLMFTVTEQ
jgi:hypothetical protein